MRNDYPATSPTWCSIALAGAATGVGLTFAYALAFALYAVLRSSATIWALTPPAVGMFETLAASGASIVVAAVATASLLAGVMAVLGMSTALVINWLLALWNPQHAPGRAILIGAVAALGVIALCQLGLHLALEAGLGRSLFSLGTTTYLFWFGLPGLLYICAGALGAWQLNLQRSAGPRRREKLAGIPLAEQTA